MTIRRCLSLLAAWLTGTLLPLAALATPSVPAATAFSACSTNPCYGGIEQAGVSGMILPRGPLAAGAQGDLYAQYGCCDVARLSLSGAVLARWHIVSHSAPATIQAIAVDRRGNVYATDALKLRIDRLSPSGKTLSPWGGFGSAPGKFELPEGIAADAAGHIYVADLKRIEKLSPGGKPLATWKGSATGIAVDRHGDIYAAERDRIVKLSHSGKVLAVWGKRGTSHVKLKLARWLAVDARGNVYVSDTVRAQGSHSWQRVQKLSSAGKVLGSWQLARDQAIGGIAVDTRGNVYVSSGDVSGGSHTTVTPPRITKYSSTGKVLAVWT